MVIIYTVLNLWSNYVFGYVSDGLLILQNFSIS